MPNYDGKTLQPSVLPSRFPNLLVNGSAGIAVGMATQIPPHNLREVAAGAEYYLKHPEIGREELLEHLLTIIKGPDFPTGALIMGHRGIEDAYRTGRGSIIMRAVVNVEEIGNRQALVVTELPYQVNPDMLAMKIADLVKDGKVSGIADINDETSGRTGQRLVITLKRDAVAKVVLNNLYKHTQLQTTFGANMLALVDEVPRTLPLDGFIRHWVDHQIEVIVRRTTVPAQQGRGRHPPVARLPQGARHARRGHRPHPRLAHGRGRPRRPHRAALRSTRCRPRRSSTCSCAASPPSSARRSSRTTTPCRQMIDEYRAILASEQRQRDIVSEELRAIVDKYGDERRTEIFPFDGDMSMEDLIPEEDVVVTITRGGYAKRTRVDQYRSQKRGGKGVRGASLRGEDVVEHFFTTTTHHWLLFFTNLGRVYRAKAYELPEGSRDSKGQHVANLLAFQPGEQIAQVLAIRDYEKGDYLVLATRAGLVKKTRLSDYDSPRSGGLIAINLRDGDELVGAGLASNRDDLLLVSRKGQSVRFTATDEALRPMGRSTSGVTGMKFRAGDHLLAMAVVEEGESPDVFVVFENGLAKRTPVVGVPPPGPRRPRHPGRQALRQGRRPRRRPHGERDRRGHGRHGEGQDRALAGRRGAPHRPLDAGREVRRSRQGRLDRRRRPQRRVGHRGRARGRGRGWAGAGTDGVDGDTTGVSGVSADGAPATVPGPDGVPSDETETNDASSDGDSGGDE